VKSTGIDLQDKLCAMPTCVDLFLTSEEQEDVPGRLAQVNLHDSNKSCVQIVVFVYSASTGKVRPGIWKIVASLK
jgi:hypothetical protein